jgi:hypothetical protein
MVEMAWEEGMEGMMGKIATERTQRGQCWEYCTPTKARFFGGLLSTLELYGTADPSLGMVSRTLGRILTAHSVGIER